MEIIKIKNKEFKIIPENKTVYGKIKKANISKEVKAVLTEDEFKVVSSVIADDILNQIVDNNQYIYAKAVCSPEDEFDKWKGIEITSAKLEKKNHDRIAKLYDRALRHMNSASRELEDLCTKHMRKARAIKKDLDEHYCGGTR